jgi:hypothetical protein
VRVANEVYASGTFLEVLQFRIREVPAFLPLHSYVFPRTLGLFLLGALSWRMGLFDGSPRVSRWLRPAAALLIGAGLVLTVALAAHRTWGPAGTILLALGYAALVVSIEATKIGHRWLRWAQPLARISHRVKRIEAPNQRKFFCEKDFAMIRGAPRCRQSVAQNGLILEWWKAALWKRPSMRDW